jgi:hypothetical protein
MEYVLYIKNYGEPKPTFFHSLQFHQVQSTVIFEGPNLNSIPELLGSRSKIWSPLTDRQTDRQTKIQTSHKKEIAVCSCKYSSATTLSTLV